MSQAENELVPRWYVIHTYSGYENGSRTIPPEILVKLAGIYHVSVDYLLGVTDERKPYKSSYIAE